MKLTLAIAGVMGALMSGCDAASTIDESIYQQVRHDIKVSPEPGRFEIHRVDLVTDNTAYNNTRGIYVIHDSRTGKQYLGVSGIGISELAAHSTGSPELSGEK